MSTPELRDYQKHCVEFATNRSIVCLPTGTGKSLVIFKIYEKYLDKNPCVVVPSLELKVQLTKTLKGYGLNDPKVYCFKSAHKKASNHQLFLHDECHHTAASTWSKIGHHGEHIGFTATPTRLDGQPLPFFDTLIEPHPVSWYFDNGYLERPKEYALPFSLISDELKVLVKKPEQRPTLMKFLWEIKKYISKDNKSIFFVSDIETAELLAELLQSYNLATKAIHSRLNYKERLDILEQFKTNQLSAVVNVAILTEGVDVPQCDRVVILRNTQSATLYYQIVGRGTRPYPNKDFKILDFGANLESFGSVAQAGLWSDWLDGETKNVRLVKTQTAPGDEVEEVNVIMPKRYGLTLKEHQSTKNSVIIKRLINNFRARGRVDSTLWRKQLKELTLSEGERNQVLLYLDGHVSQSVIDRILR